MMFWKITGKRDILLKTFMTDKADILPMAEKNT